MIGMKFFDQLNNYQLQAKTSPLNSYSNKDTQQETFDIIKMMKIRFQKSSSRTGQIRI
jgi:hypothetical protein